jgi:hypothetical protein
MRHHLIAPAPGTRRSVETVVAARLALPEVPRVTDVADALGRPYLAMLSARVHANGPDGLAIARAALQVLPTLPRDRNVVYMDIIWSALGDAR